jgi:hypothetical protein
MEQHILQQMTIKAKYDSNLQLLLKFLQAYEAGVIHCVMKEFHKRVKIKNLMN